MTLKLNYPLLFAQAILLAAIIIFGSMIKSYFGSTAMLPSPSPTPSQVVKADGLDQANTVVSTDSPSLPAGNPVKTTLPIYPHPQIEYHALTTPSVAGLSQNQPFLQRITAGSGLTKLTSSNTGPLIAVIDSGFALHHEALINRWQATPGGVGWLGYDFVNNDSDPSTGTSNPNGSGAYHGTMTAGLAGAINPNSTLLPIQALDDNGTGFTDAVAAAVRYAADSGAKVISLSLGSSQDDPYLHQQINYAISHGSVVVAAAGNDGCDCLSYPAAYPEVIAVGASTATDAIASFSSYGSNLDFLAPGTAGDVCSSFYTPTNSTNAYSCSYSGTSFSAPIAAGLVALILQQNSGLNQSSVEAVLKNSAAKIASMNGQSSTLTAGFGRITANSAMLAVTYSQPYGQLLSRQSLSLSSTGLAGGPLMDTTCSAFNGGSCNISIIGPNNQVIDLGTKAFDSYGGAEFNWNAATLGLIPGSWQIKATLSAYGQTVATSTQTLTVTP